MKLRILTYSFVRIEEIGWEQPNKQGEAADKIEALRRVEGADTSGTVEVERIYYSKKDPYTKQDIKDPVQNRVCSSLRDLCDCWSLRHIIIVISVALHIPDFSPVKATTILSAQLSSNSKTVICCV